MGEDEPGHRSCSGRMPIELWSRWSRRLEDSVEQPVAEWSPDGGAWQISRIR